METEKELKARISWLNAIVQDKFPELALHIQQMPPEAPYGRPLSKLEQLRACYDSMAFKLKSHIHQFTNNKY